MDRALGRYESGNGDGDGWIGNCEVNFWLDEDKLILRAFLLQLIGNGRIVFLPVSELKNDLFSEILKDV